MKLRFPPVSGDTLTCFRGLCLQPTISSSVVNVFCHCDTSYSSGDCGLLCISYPVHPCLPRSILECISNHKPLFSPAMLKPAAPESGFLSQRQSSSVFGRIHQLNRHEFEQTLGDSRRQGRLACCSPWGHKESNTTEQLNKKFVPISRGDIT